MKVKMKVVKRAEKGFYYNILCCLFSGVIGSGFLFGTSSFRHSSLSSSSRSQSEACHEKDNTSKTDVALRNGMGIGYGSGWGEV